MFVFMLYCFFQFCGMVELGISCRELAGNSPEVNGRHFQACTLFLKIK
jgi:hypothetical protein